MARFPFLPLLPLVALLGACQQTSNNTPYVNFSVVNGLTSFDAVVRVRIAASAPEASGFTRNGGGELGHSAPAGTDVCILARRVGTTPELEQSFALNVGSDPTRAIRVVVTEQNGLPTFTSNEAGVLNGCS